MADESPPIPLDATDAGLEILDAQRREIRRFAVRDVVAPRVQPPGTNPITITDALQHTYTWAYANTATDPAANPVPIARPR